MAETNPDDLRDRPIGDLVERLSANVRELVRAELALARAELAAAARRLAVAAGLAVTAAVLGLLALGALTATAVIALANVWPAWLAALVVALVLAALAGILLVAGIAIGRRAAPPVPTDTIESIKEDVEWVKTRARSGMT
jgi:uncharacterized membrane protein YqjE